MNGSPEWKTVISLIISNQDRMFLDIERNRKAIQDASREHSESREHLVERIAIQEAKTVGEFKNIYTRIGIITTIAAAVGATIPTIFFLINMYKNAGAPTGP